LAHPRDNQRKPEKKRVRAPKKSPVTSKPGKALEARTRKQRKKPMPVKETTSSRQRKETRQSGGPQMEELELKPTEELRLKLLEEEFKLRQKQPQAWTKTKYRPYANFRRPKTE